MVGWSALNIHSSAALRPLPRQQLSATAYADTVDVYVCGCVQVLGEPRSHCSGALLLLVVAQRALTHRSHPCLPHSQQQRQRQQEERVVAAAALHQAHPAGEGDAAGDGSHAGAAAGRMTQQTTQQQITMMLLGVMQLQST